MQGFWETISKQLDELKTATSAADVLRILAVEKNPYGDPDIAGPNVDGFFAGSGGDDSVADALFAAGWKVSACEDMRYHYAMRAPDGSHITYCEGDIYNGNSFKQRGN